MSKGQGNFWSCGGAVGMRIESIAEREVVAVVGDGEWNIRAWWL